jgi:hypothetical protein
MKDKKIICFTDTIYDDFNNIPEDDREKLLNWFTLNKHKLNGHYDELDYEEFQKEFNTGMTDDYVLILIL